jgi:hypothetical protein
MNESKRFSEDFWLRSNCFANQSIEEEVANKPGLQRLPLLPNHAENLQALFVHGMGRSPLSGWPLFRKLKKFGIVTSTFGYAVTFQDFSKIVSRLASCISKQATQGDYILIGHSLGGLLLRAAMATLPPSTRLPLHVFLLGSPIKSARLARKLRNNLIYRMLTRDCGQFLASDERMDSVGALTTPTTVVVGVRGIHATFSAFQDVPNDGVLAASEVSAEWATDEIRIPVIHTLLPASSRVAAIILDRIGGKKLTTNTEIT